VRAYCLALLSDVACVLMKAELIAGDLIYVGRTVIALTAAQYGRDVNEASSRRGQGRGQVTVTHASITHLFQHQRSCYRMSSVRLSVRL